VIKLVYVVRRRPELSPKQFSKRWLEHGALVARVARAVRAVRYAQSHAIDTPLNERLAQSRGLSPAYDGITEVWWDSMEELVAGMSTPEGAAAHKELLDDEREFIDFAGSSIVLTEEHAIL
jgi:hypothetical protein